MLRQAFQGYRQAVRRPAFRRFWLGTMISRAGDTFTVSPCPGSCSVSRAQFSWA